MSRPSIVVLGAGVCGLTLGRCLRRKGVSSVIYDRASSAPRHSYGITLEPWAYKPLLDLLNIDELTFRTRVAVDTLNQDGTGRVDDGHTGSSTAFRANRAKLESLLREGQTIHFEHSLSSATISGGDYSMELKFQNGSTLRTAQVVDALGVHSQLRRSLLPDVTLAVHPCAVYSGKREVKADIFKSTYAHAFGNGDLVLRQPSGSGEPRLEISINDILPNGNVSISYIYSREARNGPNSIDRLHHPDRPTSGATNIPGEFYEELIEFINAHRMDQPFAECFNVDHIRNERLLHWLMRTVMVPKHNLIRLLQHGVIMIGDAAHAVPILGGHGANLAILDAVELANVLAEQHRETTELQDFYENRWDSWYDAVEDSKKRLVDMHRKSSMTRSVSQL